MSATKRLFEKLVDDAVVYARSTPKRHFRLSPFCAATEAVQRDSEARMTHDTWVHRILPEVEKAIDLDMQKRARTPRSRMSPARKHA